MIYMIENIFKSQMINKKIAKKERMQPKWWTYLPWSKVSPILVSALKSSDLM